MCFDFHKRHPPPEGVAEAYNICEGQQLSGTGQLGQKCAPGCARTQAMDNMKANMCSPICESELLACTAHHGSGSYAQCLGELRSGEFGFGPACADKNCVLTDKMQGGTADEPTAPSTTPPSAPPPRPPSPKPTPPSVTPKPQGTLSYDVELPSVSVRTVLWTGEDYSVPNHFNGDIGVAAAQAILDAHTPVVSTGQNLAYGAQAYRYAGTLGSGARLFNYQGEAFSGGSALIINAMGLNYLMSSGDTAHYIETDADGYITTYALVTVP
jgi:hypothetical protein